MSKDKIDRKALKEDAFQDTVFWMIQWFHKHRIWIVIGVTSVVVLVAGVFGFRFYEQYATRRQAADFSLAEKGFLKPGVSPEKRLEEGNRLFEHFVDEHPDGTLAPVAWMYLARIAWEQKRMDDAQAAFQKVVEHGESTVTLRDLARIGIAKVAEAKGNLDRAEKIYQELPDKQYQSLKDYSLGRLAMERHKTDDARQYFDKAAKVLPVTGVTQWAQQALEYLP